MSSILYTGTTRDSFTQASTRFREDDEIDILELVAQFLAQWRWWVVGAVAGGLAGLTLSLIVNPRYEASAVIRVAQVAKLMEKGVQTGPAESVAETIARLQTLVFRQEVVQRLVQQKAIAEADRAVWVAALSDKASFKPIKDATSFFALTVSASDPALARTVAAVIMQLLKERQQMLVAESTGLLDRRIGLAQDNLKLVEKTFSEAQQGLAQDKTGRMSQLELARLSEAGTFTTLRQEVIDMENAKRAPYTRATELVEPIGVSSRPVFPRKSLFGVGGILIGFMLGTGLGFAIPAWRKFKLERQAV